MKNLSDEEIQEMLDKGFEPNDIEISAINKPNIKQFHLLFDLLDKDQEGSLPYDFTASVIREVKVITDRRIALKWYIFSFLGGCTAIGFTLALLGMYSSAAGNHFYRFITAYKLQLAAVFIVMLAAHYFDSWLKKDKAGVFSGS